jgi:hypothetical protein
MDCEIRAVLHLVSDTTVSDNKICSGSVTLSLVVFQQLLLQKHSAVICQLFEFCARIRIELLLHSADGRSLCKAATHSWMHVMHVADEAAFASTDCFKSCATCCCGPYCMLCAQAVHNLQLRTASAGTSCSSSVQYRRRCQCSGWAANQDS